MRIIPQFKRVRKSKGLTQKQLAAKIGFSEKRYADLERSTKIINCDILARLCKELECTVDDLFDIERG